MKNVTLRFVEFYNYLIDSGIVRNAKEFAISIDVSVSMITEISKGRTNVGMKAIQNSVLKFDLNSDWLLTGKGAMLRGSSVVPLQGSGVSGSGGSGAVIALLERQLASKELELKEAYKKIGKLEHIINELKKESTRNAYIINQAKLE